MAYIPKQTIIDLTDLHPRIARGFWWSTLVDEAILRHWLLNLGQRDAFERVAHLFCELWDRLSQVGLRADDKMDVPLTQEQLGDTLGLTSVHVNRMLQRLRGERLIELSNKSLRILDVNRLRTVAGYDPAYLHLKKRNSVAA
ncbi:MAG: Crp/Fnr family transcriptional regulator [Cytophagaceae bacterium]|nr:MAG: Crp/Fnr family transcriptional regulator [Cytophagaceae bacterium]